MATLHTANKVKVTVYAADHLPPHFHVRTVDAEALVLISDLSVLRGTMNVATRRAVWPWIETNTEAIAAEWNKLNPRFPIAR